MACICIEKIETLVYIKAQCSMLNFIHELTETFINYQIKIDYKND